MPTGFGAAEMRNFERRTKFRAEIRSMDSLNRRLCSRKIDDLDNMALVDLAPDKKKQRTGSADGNVENNNERGDDEDVGDDEYEESTEDAANKQDGDGDGCDGDGDGEDANDSNYSPKIDDEDQQGKQGEEPSSLTGKKGKRKGTQGKKVEAIRRVDNPKTRNRTKFFDFITRLTDEQKQAVNEMGFGSFLHIRIKNMNMDFGRYLLNHFDYCKTYLMLEGAEKLHITDEDVEICLGLPRGDQIVKEAKQRCNPTWYNEFIGTWRQRWGFEKHKDSPKTTEMPDRILQFGGAGDDFKRDFIIYVVSTFFKVHQSNNCTHSILWSLKDTSMIKRLNWCKYMVDCLINSTEAWRKSKSRFYTGPMLFIMLCYLDNVEFKGKKVQRSIPTVLQWSQKDYNDRLKEEMKTGGFGKGRPLKKLEVAKSVQQPQTQEDAGSKDNHKEDILEKINNVARDAGQLFTSLSELMEKAGTIGQVHKIGEGISGMLTTMMKENPESSSQSKYELEDDDDFFNESVMNAIREIEMIYIAKMNRRNNTQCEMPSFSLGISEDLNLQPTKNNGQEMHQAEDEEENDQRQEQLDMKTKNERNRENRTTILGDQEDNGMPSFSLGITQDNDMPSFSLGITQDNEMPQTENNVVETGEANKDKHTPLQLQEKKKRRRKYGPDLRSPFYMREVEVHSELTKAERLVSTYVLDESLDKYEMLYRDQEDELVRGNFLTMKESRYVENSIIDKWSRILNLQERRRSDASPKRIFMSCMLYSLIDDNLKNASLDTACPGKTYKNFCEMIKTDLKYAAIQMKDADMVMFPIAKEDHFYVVCFNFKSHVVEIIDNMPLSSTVKEKYGNVLKSLTRAFKKWLEEQKNLKAERIDAMCKKRAMFVKLRWQFKSNGDCGIYTMRHMETYMGRAENWDCGFWNENEKCISERYKETMKRLRCRIVAKVITDDLNIFAEDVMTRINQWDEERSKKEKHHVMNK